MKALTCILKQPIPRFSLSNFAVCLFLFNCIFDPGNALFHTKQITFFFALAANIKKMTLHNYFPVINFVLFYVAFFVSVSLMMLRNINYDPSFVNMYSTTFLLLAIFFIDNQKIDVNAGFNVTLLASGENRHYESGENSQKQSEEKSHCQVYS